MPSASGPRPHGKALEEGRPDKSQPSNHIANHPSSVSVGGQGGAREAVQGVSTHREHRCRRPLLEHPSLAATLVQPIFTVRQSYSHTAQCEKRGQFPERSCVRCPSVPRTSPAASLPVELGRSPRLRHDEASRLSRSLRDISGARPTPTHSTHAICGATWVSRREGARGSSVKRSADRLTVIPRGDWFLNCLKLCASIHKSRARDIPKVQSDRGRHETPLRSTGALSQSCREGPRLLWLSQTVASSAVNTVLS